jgi:hypothetical protein
MNNGFKELWFNYYVLIVLFFLLLIMVVFSIFTEKTGESSLSSFATFAGIGLTTIYFVQKQKLEEIKLFKNLFTEFNSRYDRLNGKISDIKSKKIDDPNAINKILDDYFNICSEEYLFYKEGRIHKQVWGSWCRGMKEHLLDPVINSYWEKAQKENSYYGLATEVIEKGAIIKA